MATIHEANAPMTAAKGGCYNCTNPNDVVVFDAIIEGEGILVLCTACIIDAATAARAGRARLARLKKAEDRAVADERAREREQART